MTNSADPDQLASSVGFFRSQLVWIYTVCKDRVYPGSSGQWLRTEVNNSEIASYDESVPVFLSVPFVGSSKIMYTYK